MEKLLDANWGFARVSLACERPPLATPQTPCDSDGRAGSFARDSVERNLVTRKKLKNDAPSAALPNHRRHAGTLLVAADSSLCRQRISADPIQGEATVCK
jgi:hypothetical protein